MPTAADERIGLREAAERLGVHYMTAYRYVRSGRLPADKVGDEWRVRVADLHTVRPGRPEDPPGPLDRPRSPAMARRLEDRLVAGDEAGAWRILEEAATAGMPPSALLVELLAPALRSIGDRWAAGELVIADEHRASAVAARLVGRLGPRHTRPGRRRGTIVLGAVAGDRHGLPTAIMGDLLRGAGFEVVDLGADTPAASFVDVARSLDRLVALGVCITAPEALDGAVGQVRHLRRELPDVPVVVGGGAVPDADTARALGSDGFAADPVEVVDLFGSFTTRSVG